MVSIRRIGMVSVMALVVWAGGCSNGRKSPPVDQPAPDTTTAEAPVSASAAPATQPATRPAAKAFAPIELKHVHNVHRVTDKVISGSQPEGPEGLAELAALGVRTIISVDGITPDAEGARKLGMRYVHLPISYDGVPAEQGKAIAKAIRELPGPIYIHCHHGKHRSPTAAAVACVAAKLIEPGKAVDVLRTAGTNENYRGLYGVAESVKPLDDEVLNALPDDFPEVAEVPPFIEAMVALEQTHSNIKAIAAAGWKSPPDHPDLAPAHEALLLREHFAEMARSETAQNESEAFLVLLKESEEAAKELEELLKQGVESPEQVSAAAAAFDRISQRCGACHKQFRDVPLSEKQAKP